MTLEFTNNPNKDSNAVEKFTQELLENASRKHPTQEWVRIPADENSEFEGFKHTDKEGNVTALQIDSIEDPHIQLSLRCISSGGTSILTSTEWSTEKADNVPLKTLYSLLDERIPPISGIVPPLGKQDSQRCLPMLEQLISCLTMDANTTRSVTWEAHLCENGLPSYCAEGITGKDAKFWIIPEMVDEANDKFTFRYDLNNDEVLSYVQQVPAATHSPLRDLYHAVVSTDALPEITRVERYVADEKRHQFMQRLLNDNIEEKPTLLIGDIFRECNAGIVSNRYVEENTSRQPNLRSNADELKRLRILAVSTIEVLRRCKRNPNHCVFSSHVIDVAKKDGAPSRIRFSTSSLARISNAECTYLYEFYAGVPRKRAVNEAAVMILSAILRDY